MTDITIPETLTSPRNNKIYNLKNGLTVRKRNSKETITLINSKIKTIAVEPVDNTETGATYNKLKITIAFDTLNSTTLVLISDLEDDKTALTTLANTNPELCNLVFNTNGTPDLSELLTFIQVLYQYCWNTIKGSTELLATFEVSEEPEPEQEPEQEPPAEDPKEE